MIASTFVLILLATWVTEKIVAPRFGKYEGNAELDVDGSLSNVEKKGLKSWYKYTNICSYYNSS